MDIVMNLIEAGIAIAGIALMIKGEQSGDKNLMKIGGAVVLLAIAVEIFVDPRPRMSDGCSGLVGRLCP